MSYFYFNLKKIIFFTTLIFFISTCGQINTNATNKIMTVESSKLNDQNSLSIKRDTATFGAGCFWCVEAIFQRLKGVMSIKSGYAGGELKNPSYKEVCSGSSGHAEVCQIIFDPTIISFDQLLEVFWKTHDPTTLNQQGNDFGTQYRSVIFWHNQEQKNIAEELKKQINDLKAYPNPVITEITQYRNYFEAEGYHQNYYNLNGSEGYCQFVIQPKIEKFEKIFKNKIKSN